ncbi:hypothetical protein B0H14DRAFT_3123786 [Mycena olivaceomarginata]|nr:hypothetical protein B0H14DRAFT_3123786 [Mycena olivaceomarginata]
MVHNILPPKAKTEMSLLTPLSPNWTRSKLQAKIRVWYNNNTTLFRLGGEIKEADKKAKVKRWDAKAVAQNLHRVRYDEIKSEVIAAGAEWNNVHHSTTTRLWDELTDKEQKICQETASSRNTGDISEKDKRELACGNADKEVTAFVKRMQTIYGVRMLCLSSWTDTDGKVQTSVHETMSTSPRFTQQFPRWKTMRVFRVLSCSTRSRLQIILTRRARTRMRTPKIPTNQNTPGRS